MMAMALSHPFKEDCLVLPGRLFSATSSRACLLQVIADVQKGQICLNVKVWTSVPGREGVGGGV